MRMLLLLVPVLLAGAEIHVDPAGDDAADGSASRPVASLARAKALAQAALAARIGADVEVVLHQGRWRLDEPLVFTAEDGGGLDRWCTWRAAPGARPVIDGSVAVGPWMQAGGRWTAPLPAGPAGEQLIVDEAWIPPASVELPLIQLARDALAAEGTGWTLTVGDGPLPDPARGPLRAVVLRSWSSYLARVDATDLAARTVRLDPQAWAGQPKDPTKTNGNQFTPANVKRFRLRLAGHPDLVEAGTWAEDRSAGRIVYQPAAGTAGPGTAAMPRLPRLLVIAGTAKAPVLGLRLRGLVLSGAGWTVPAAGCDDKQAALASVPPGGGDQLDRAALVASFWRRGGLEDCAVLRSGGHGVVLAAGCRDLAVDRLTVEDVGANGLAIGTVRDPGRNAPDLVQDIAIRNSTVRRFGRVRDGAVGIWVAIARTCTIDRNEVADGPYSAISLGWRWDPGASSAGGHVVTGNHLHHVMQTLCDGAGIYALGRQEGSRMAGNHIHDIRRDPKAHASPIAGIYLDEGSLGWTVEGNVVHDLDDRAVNLHRPGMDKAVPPTVVAGFANIFRANVLVAQGDGTAGQRQPPYGKKQQLYGADDAADEIISWSGNRLIAPADWPRERARILSGVVAGPAAP
jgi:hypothetical protein